MKQCTLCKELKPLRDFPIRRAGKDGHAHRCGSCNAQLAKEWRKKNPDRARENSLKSTAKLRETNPNYWNEWFSRRYHGDSEYRAKWIANVQARRCKAELNFTAEEFAELCLGYGGKCLGCNKDDAPLTVDHVIPVSRGGSNDITNIQPLCKPCNSSKGTKTIDYRPF